MVLSSLATNLAAHPATALPLVFAGGVLTSLTPCIYPMIPITAAIVGGQSVAGTASGASLASPPRRARAVALSGAYVLGLSLAYASLGLVAGLTGTLCGAISTNPWLYLAMANLLLAFALMMLEVVPVPVPRRALARAASLDARGRVAGAFAMGAVSGLVAAPCGAPVFAAVLTFVAATHSALLGFGYLFAFSLGMCALLVVVGLAAGGAVRLPKAGPWMLWVKRGFAIVMIGAAEYYLIQMGQLVL
jgi:thiol:disulfide interchange protein DsbD